LITLFLLNLSLFCCFFTTIIILMNIHTSVFTELSLLVLSFRSTFMFHKIFIILKSFIIFFLKTLLFIKFIQFLKLFLINLSLLLSQFFPFNSSKRSYFIDIHGWMILKNLLSNLKHIECESIFYFFLIGLLVVTIFINTLSAH